MLAAAVVALLVTGASGATAPGDQAPPPAGSASMQIVVTIPPRDEIPLTGAATVAPTLTVRGDSLGYTAEVTGRESGPVELWDGDRLVAVVPAGRGPAAFHSNAVVHELVARRGDLASAPVAVGTQAPAPRGNVAVTIPTGALSVTTRRGVVTVTDTRAGELGFHVCVSAERGTTLRGLHASQVPGNAMRAADLRVAPGPVRLRAGLPRTVAVYPSGLSLGSVRLDTGDAVHRLTWTVL